MNKTIGILMLAVGFVVGISISGAYAVLADDLICDKCVDGPDLAPNSVGTGKIKDNSVKTIDLANKSVGSKKIKDNTVKSIDIKDDSITGIDIADHAVGSVDMAISWVTNTMVGLSTGDNNVEVGVTCFPASSRALSGEIYPNNVITQIVLNHSGDDNPRTWTFNFDVKGDSVGNQEVKWRVACLGFTGP